MFSSVCSTGVGSCEGASASARGCAVELLGETACGPSADGREPHVVTDVRFVNVGDCNGRLEIDPHGRLDSDERVDIVCVVDEEKVEPRWLWLVPLDSELYRDALSGKPSHLLFTLGTCCGSFCDETPGKPTAVALPPFCLAFSFSAAANCSNANVEGSFRVRKPSNPVFFFFLPGWDLGMAWLNDRRVELIVSSLSRCSKGGREFANDECEDDGGRSPLWLLPCVDGR